MILYKGQEGDFELRVRGIGVPSHELRQAERLIARLLQLTGTLPNVRECLIIDQETQDYTLSYRIANREFHAIREIPKLSVIFYIEKAE
jgi:hypothetical protein